MATTTLTTATTTTAQQIARDFCDYLLRTLDAAQLNARQRRALRCAVMAASQRYSRA